MSVGIPGILSTYAHGAAALQSPNNIFANLFLQSPKIDVGRAEIRTTDLPFAVNTLSIRQPQPPDSIFSYFIGGISKVYISWV